jgi:hypothetical protein
MHFISIESHRNGRANARLRTLGHRLAAVVWWLDVAAYMRPVSHPPSREGDETHRKFGIV